VPPDPRRPAGSWSSEHHARVSWMGFPGPRATMRFARATGRGQHAERLLFGAACSTTALALAAGFPATCTRLANDRFLKPTRSFGVTTACTQTAWRVRVTRVCVWLDLLKKIFFFPLRSQRIVIGKCSWRTNPGVMAWHAPETGKYF